MSGALAFFLGGLIIQLSSRTVSKSGVPSPETATYNLVNDGRVTNQSGGQLELWDNQPATTGNYWVNATFVSGTAPTGSATGVWLNLGTSRGWTITASGSGNTQSCTLTVQIASDSGGVNIVATATVTITASVA